MAFYFQSDSSSSRMGVSGAYANWAYNLETQHEKRLRLFKEFVSCNHLQRLNILRELLQS